MKRILPLWIFSFLLLFTFCGTKGPLIAPVKKIPQKIENLVVIQRGEKIILSWKNPKNYTDGEPLLEIKEIEVWLLEEQLEFEETEWEFSLEESEALLKIPLEVFKKEAKLESVIKKDTFPEYQIKKDEDTVEHEYSLGLTSERLIFKRLTIALRVKDGKNRESEFSDMLSIEPRFVPSPPQEVESTLFEDRIEITWKLPRTNIDGSSPASVRGYNIYRIEKKEELPRRINASPIVEKELSEEDFIFGKAYYLLFKAYDFLAQERKFSDRAFQFGKTYRYFVRATLEKSPPFWESDDSATVEVLAEDVFAPVPPSGLVSVVGGNFISISWEENTEQDLAGYRVWRRSEGQEEFTLLTPQPIRENIFNDSTVEKNMRYYYAITAQDENGNESKKSESIFEMIKEEFS